jgi:iron complex transport system permease protein
VQRLKRLAMLATAAAAPGRRSRCPVGIGFVGIVVPHLLRLAAGPDQRADPAACGAAGGALLVGWPTWWRAPIVAPAELPIGILTAADRRAGLSVDPAAAARLAGVLTC